jgi:Kef-type K+ transport system membrane component KefB
MRAVALGLLLVGVPALAVAASGGNAPDFAPLLFAVAVLVLAAKAGGLAAEAAGQPPVLGELLAGIVLGNALPLLGGADATQFRADPTILFLAEVGVLVLLFDVGLEVDLRALWRVGVPSILVAVTGLVLPLGLGAGVSAWLLPAEPALVHVFVGAALSATSVGITARVLKDLDASATAEGRIILGAAIVDDVLGLIVLAVVAGSGADAGGAAPWVRVVSITVTAVVFLALTALVGHVMGHRIVRRVHATGGGELLLVVGLALCFAMSYAAAKIGLAAIIGAFAAGVLLDPHGKGARADTHEHVLRGLVHPITALFAPLFFVLIGARLDVAAILAPGVITLAILLSVVAVVTKLATGAVVRGRLNRLAIGFGMVPRGEVGLIFASIGAATLVAGRPVLAPEVFSALVAMVLVTTLVAPAGLRWALRRGERRG